MNPSPLHTPTSKRHSQPPVFLLVYSHLHSEHGQLIPPITPTKSWFLSSYTIHHTPTKLFMPSEIKYNSLCHNYLINYLLQPQLTMSTYLPTPARPSNNIFCITNCPYHYGGDDFFSNDETGLLQAELHGNNIHQAILTSLPTDTLTSIGWNQCCNVCSALFLSTGGLSHHQSLCSNFTTTITTTTTPIPQIDEITETVKEKLYFLCPTSWIMARRTYLFHRNNT